METVGDIPMQAGFGDTVKWFEDLEHSIWGRQIYLGACIYTLRSNWDLLLM